MQLPPCLSLLGVVAGPRSNHLIWIQSTTQKLRWKQSRIPSDSQTLLKVHLLFSSARRRLRSSFFWKPYELLELEYRLRNFVMNHSVPPTPLFMFCVQKGVSFSHLNSPHVTNGFLRFIFFLDTLQRFWMLLLRNLPSLSQMDEGR